MSRRSLTIALLSLALPAVVPCRGADQGAWIAVVAPALQKAFEPLAEARRKEGWQVTVLTVEADTASARQRIAAVAAQIQPVCVVLAGQTGPFTENGTVVPTGVGQMLRMKGQATDSTWSSSGGGKPVEVGRLPARTVEEAEVMVQKTIAWPQSAAAALPHPVVRLVAGYHEAPPAFAGIADNLTNTLTNRLVARLPAGWGLEAAIDVGGSAWPVPASALGRTAQKMSASRSTMLAYMGHSGSQEAVSRGVSLFGGRQWRDLPASAETPGLFFTCGCYSCSLKSQGESYSLAAVRAPGGPPAVIGAVGESWAAMGYLAMAGLTARLEKEPAINRVGEFWSAARMGLQEGEISAAEFAMMDLADGTRGQVPLDQQRLEHLEMWLLLGDPAMPLIPEGTRIPIEFSGEPQAGKSWEVSGTLPAGAAGNGPVMVSLERHPGTIPGDLPEVPASGATRDAAMLERNRRATDVVVVSAMARVVDGRYSATLPLPANLPPRPWTIRVTAGGFSGIRQIR